MIKRLDLASITRRAAAWPGDSDNPTDGHLFSGRKAFRKIVLLVDSELLDDAEPQLASGETGRAETLLASLLGHPLVSFLRYADDGPPQSVSPSQGPFAGRVFEDWVVLDGEPKDGVWTVVYPIENGYSVSGVIGNAPDVAFGDTRSDVYSNLPASDAAKRRRADELAAQVAAQAINADIFVTARPYLYETRRRSDRGVTICRPEEAIAELGLYLRAQGEFQVARGLRFNRGLYYWVGARELLPAAWRWFSACVQSATGSGDEALMLLGGSLLERVDRALEARDEIHIALNQPQNNDLMEDALTGLDIVLVLLMGAVDAAARVAHVSLGLPAENEYRAGWQYTKSGGWLDQVRQSRPTLAEVVDTGTEHQQVFTILRLLRNSVHGVALQGVAVKQSGARLESLIGLPKRDEGTILRAMEALGGQGSWGLRSVGQGRSYVDPGMLVDRLFVGVIALLNALMTHTPVEELPYVTAVTEDSEELATSTLGAAIDPFAASIRRNIRAQLGF